MYSVLKNTLFLLIFENKLHMTLGATGKNTVIVSIW